MTLPLMLLAVVTIVAGFIPFGHFISSNGEAYSIHLDWSVAGTSIVVAVVALAIATYIYAGSRQPVANALARRFKGLWTRKHRFYLDEVSSSSPPHHLRLHLPPHRLVGPPRGRRLLQLPCLGAEATGDEIRGLQSGRIQQYTFVFLLGTLALILLLLL